MSDVMLAMSVVVSDMSDVRHRSSWTCTSDMSNAVSDMAAMASDMSDSHRRYVADMSDGEVQTAACAT